MSGSGLASATQITIQFRQQIKEQPGWKISGNTDKGILVIEGWTDPKTKKFHPVKSIKFELKDLPKEYMPTIKMPPNL